MYKNIELIFLMVYKIMYLLQKYFHDSKIDGMIILIDENLIFRQIVLIELIMSTTVATINA